MLLFELRELRMKIVSIKKKPNVPGAKTLFILIKTRNHKKSWRSIPEAYLR